MRQLTIQKKLILFFAILTATFYSSCNSVGPDSDKLVGEWVRQYSSYTKGEDYGLVQSSGFTMSWETTLILEKGGEGKSIEKTITTWDHNSNNLQDQSRTIKYPIKWETKKDGNEYYLITKSGAGKIIDLQGENKIKQEQEAANIMRIVNGRVDTTYFKVNSDNTIKWHLKNSNEDYVMTKR